MRKPKPIITAAEAVANIKDGQTVASTGFVQSSIPESLLTALENRYLETGSPKNLTVFYPGSQGNGKKDGDVVRGGNHFAHPGMVKRAITGHYNTAPKLGQLIMENKIEGYNFPQGTLSHLCRDMAAGKIGTITHVGLHTFVDPRNQGGKLNDITKEDLVELVNIGGKELLWYKSFPIDVVFLRGSYADEYGNVTVHREVGPGEVTAIAQATKNSGGKVYVQVEKIVKAGTLDARLVRIPGIYVDALIISEPHEHEQTYGCEFNPALCGDIKIPVDSVAPLTLSAKKVIGRRAAMELTEGIVVNLGIGAPEFVASVAGEEGISDYMTLTVEAGPVGGIPQGGPRFGSSLNPEAILSHHEQFDFYDGGGIDMAFLGLAQADENGSVNVSKFGPRLAGPGGFINITQNAKKVFYCGTFTAGGLETNIKDGKLIIEQEGREVKFIKQVEHITFNGKFAAEQKKPVKYITERAVFELRTDGVYLIEVAPGIDIQTQIIDLMEFSPKMDGQPKLMDARIFRDELMGLKDS